MAAIKWATEDSASLPFASKTPLLSNIALGCGVDNLLVQRGKILPGAS
jgi:hypothetical protein